MAKGNQARRNGNSFGKAFAQADGAPEFIAQVRQSAGQEDQPHQVTDPVEVQQVCLHILEGKICTSEIFNAKFSVEKHPYADYKVIRFLGTLDHGRFDVDKKFGPGFFIPVTKLFFQGGKIMTTPAGEDRKWDDLADWEQFVLILHSHDEMCLARDQYFIEKEQARKLAEETDKAKAAASRNMMLGSIMEKAKRKPQPLKLSNLAGILSATYATFEHTSGVTLFVCRDHNEKIVVRFKNASESHALYEQCRHNIFIKQEHLHLPTEDLTTVKGKALLTRQARQWLRTELRAVGAIPPLEASLVVEPLPPEPTGVQIQESEGVYLGKPRVCEESAAS